MQHQHLTPEGLLRSEIQQRREEGCELGDLAQQVETAIQEGTLPVLSDRFWLALDNLRPPCPAREEPSTLEAIRALRPAGIRHRVDPRATHSPSADRAALQDRIYGAWLGRCAGCTLGKPVEGWSRSRIETYLRLAGEYPLADYFPVLSPFPEGLALHANHTQTARGHIQRMARDDDLDYTVLALRILEHFGPHFTPADVAQAWLHGLPYYTIFTAEAVAYRNLINGIEPPGTARFRNPYREWIGAQIRADLWGYVNPGDPQAAAEMAFRDASISHTANGIYGAMWAAAAIAAAFVLDDPRQILLASLAEIPRDCRLAEAIRDCLGWAEGCPTWEEAWEKVNARYGSYPWVHVINNTCAIVLALLYGQGDLGKSICLAVMGGWDTDCTGATTGSILGAALGARALPARWIAPLRDRLETYIPGEGEARLSKLARRTRAQVQSAGRSSGRQP